MSCDSNEYLNVSLFLADGKSSCGDDYRDVETPVNMMQYAENTISAFFSIHVYTESLCMTNNPPEGQT